jgi:hypothetical protein
MAHSCANSPANVGLLVQIVLLAAGPAYFGWTAAGALRSGEISVYVRANRDRHFSRRANPAGYWTAVSWCLLLGMVAVAGLVLGDEHTQNPPHNDWRCSNLAVGPTNCSGTR